MWCNFQRRLISVSCSLLLLVPPLVSAADLEMVDGYGNVTGVIDASRRGLSVFEYSGDRFFYQRARQYDLPGGQYLGFYNLELNRIIRFPRSGYGPIQRADLDAPFPQFLPASVTVRPIGSGPGFAPYLDAWLDKPFGINPYYGGGPYYGPGPYAPQPFIGGYYSSGLSLSVGPIGPIGMQPPWASGYPSLQPRSTLIESRVVETEALPPVEIEFINPHNETLLVTLSDSHHPDRQPEYRIEPGASQRVRLPRDGGHTRIDVYQTYDAHGRPIQHETQVAISPEVRYQVVVHRLRIQSIAIDRTGKSPNEIEDINVQGVGVGRFVLPPGDQLVSGQVDVFAAARGAANPGSVAPILPNP